MIARSAQISRPSGSVECGNDEVVAQFFRGNQCGEARLAQVVFEFAGDPPHQAVLAQPAQQPPDLAGAGTRAQRLAQTAAGPAADGFLGLEQGEQRPVIFFQEEVEAAPDPVVFVPLGEGDFIEPMPAGAGILEMARATRYSAGNWPPAARRGCPRCRGRDSFRVQASAAARPRRGALIAPSRTGRSAP